MEVILLYISGRERKITEMLLQAEQTITIKKLGSTLKVSNRTIHRDLKNVEDFLRLYNLALSRKTGVGIEIIGHKEDKKKLHSNLQYVKHTDYTPDERQKFILYTLLETNEPTKLLHLSHQLHVTIATISNDLDEIEESLRNYRVSLIRRRGFGVKIEGEESEKRAIISHLVIDHIDEFDFLALLKSNIQQTSPTNIEVISNRLLGIIDPEKIKHIEQKVKKISTILPYGLADSAYVGLVVHLALAIERLQNGDAIQFNPDHLKKIKGLKEYQVAAKLTKELEDVLEMVIPDDEIGYITMHLMGAKSRIDHHYLLEDSNLSIAYQAKALIQYVNQTLSIDLPDQGQLLNDLVAHLKPVMYRLKQNMRIKNPLISQIMKDYHELFQVIETGVTESFPNIKFPKEEIGYLVLHFGAAMLRVKSNIELKALVVCPSGIGTAKMLSERLLQKIPEIKEVENKSVFEIDKEKIGAYDLIVSTVPLQDQENYILASPILTTTDIDHINQVIRRRKVSQPFISTVPKVKPIENFASHVVTIKNYATAILDVLEGFYIEQIKEDKTSEEMLAYICHQLADRQTLIDEQEVLSDLLAREKMNGLGIPGTQLALYHARSLGIQRISFSIYSLKTPLITQGMDDQKMQVQRILLMLAPKDTNPQELEVLSLLSGLMIQDEESTDIFQLGDETEIYSFISMQFHKLMNKKQ